MTINGIEEAKNNGEAQIIDLLEGKIFQTQETIIENMNTMLFGLTATGNSSKDWNWASECSVSGSTGSPGGIDAELMLDNSWWRSAVTNPDEFRSAITLAGSHGDPVQQLFRLVTTSRLSAFTARQNQGYEAYEALLVDQFHPLHRYRHG